MSCVPSTNEGSGSDCRMWTQTLQHLYGITLAVMPNVILHVVIAPAFYAVQQLYLEHKIQLIHILNLASSARPNNQRILARVIRIRRSRLIFNFHFLERTMF